MSALRQLTSKWTGREPLKSMITALQILRLGCQRARKTLGWNLQKFHLTEKIKMEDSELFFQCFS